MKAPTLKQRVAMRELCTIALSERCGEIGHRRGESMHGVNCPAEQRVHGYAKTVGDYLESLEQSDDN